MQGSRADTADNLYFEVLPDYWDERSSTFGTFPKLRIILTVGQVMVLSNPLVPVLETKQDVPLTLQSNSGAVR